MSVNVVRFQHHERIRWGVLHERRITPIPGEFATTGDLIRGTTARGLAALEGDPVDVSDVAILSPVTRNQQFVCQGANYRQHMIESGVDPDAKTFNMIFTKASSCIVPADSDVIRPKGVRFLDYEIELGLRAATGHPGPGRRHRPQPARVRRRRRHRRTTTRRATCRSRRCSSTRASPSARSDPWGRI